MSRQAARPPCAVHALKHPEPSCAKCRRHRKTTRPGVYKRLLCSGRWSFDCVIYAGGRGRKPFRHTCASFEAAKDWMTDHEVTKRQQGRKLTKDARTVEAYLADWLEKKPSNQVAFRRPQRDEYVPSPRTLQDYRKLLGRWVLHPKHPDLRWLQGLRVSELNHEELSNFYTLLKRHTTPGTIQRLNRLLGHAFATYALHTGAVNPAERAIVPAKPRRDPDAEEEGDCAAKSFTEAEARAMQMAARAWADAEEAAEIQMPIPARCYSAFFHLLFFAGLRPSEARALKWSDLPDVGQAVTVRRALAEEVPGRPVGQPKTRNARRTVPLDNGEDGTPNAAWGEMMKWKTRQKAQRILSGSAWQEHGYIFTSATGAPLRKITPAWDRLCRAANIGTYVGPVPKRDDGHVKATGRLPRQKFVRAHRPYDCRHTFVTLLLINGAPITVVAELAGHASAKFTLEHYGHAVPKAKVTVARTVVEIYRVKLAS